MGGAPAAGARRSAGVEITRQVVERDATNAAEATNRQGQTGRP